VHRRGRRAVGERMLAIVSEPTGYPPDLPDVDLEADLGIDTVEEVEVFASLRDACDPSALEPIHSAMSGS
jgi:hypothetical protein